MTHCAYQSKQRTLTIRKKALKKRATKSEKKFRAKLRRLTNRLGITFQFQKGFIAGRGFYIADFYIPNPHKIVIEIDGSSHDGKEAYDARRDRYLEKRGCRIIHLRNEEAEVISSDALQTLLFQDKEVKPTWKRIRRVLRKSANCEALIARWERELA